MEEKRIQIKDFCGQWTGPLGIWTFSPDGNFSLIDDSQGARWDGTFQVTQGTRFGAGQWVSPSGYFLQCDLPAKSPGSMAHVWLHPIEGCTADRLVLQTMSRE